MVTVGELRSCFMKFQWQLTSVRTERAQIFQTESCLPFYLNFHLLSFIYTLSVVKDCLK